MRLIYPVILLLLFSCGGSLNEEQRKQMREARELQSIQKVSEAEIVEAAFSQGRAIAEDLNMESAAALSAQYSVDVRWVEPGAAGGSAVEQQVIDAYINAIISGSELADNVQRIGNDSLLYSKPVVVELPDGATEVKGIWNIRMARKQLVLEMSRKKLIVY